MNIAFLSLGSNLGNKFLNIKKAIYYLSNLTATNVIKISHYYETKPFGVSDMQDNYINCCVKIGTNLSAEELLEECMKIESRLGRIRMHRFCSRTIDIDILLFGEKTICTPSLTLPHPRMCERAFVLIPLKDVLPEMLWKNLDFNMYLNKCDASGVRAVNQIY